MDSVKVKIIAKYNGFTIKEYLKDNHVGRGKIESIRVNKESYLNGAYANLETKLNEGDELAFIINEDIDFEVEDKPLKIVYEDDYLLIVSKPYDIIIYPDDKNKKGTLVNLVANYYKKQNIKRKIRYLHRIDKETTGLVLFAKDFLSEAILTKDLENHLITKEYLAFIEGKLNKKVGVINMPIAEDRHNSKKMIISPSGKEAITNYEIISIFKNYSLVKFSLLTGRTHQIRVHASYLSHPLLGDVLYGGDNEYVNRLALHAYHLAFIHPISQEKIDVKDSLPSELENLRSVYD